jgi:hypothetical protein
MRIVQYKEAYKLAWDSLISTSKNGIFLFHREYLEYHAERFPDHSLLFFDDNDLPFAVLPCVILADSTLSSHEGLTFGGLIVNHEAKVETILKAFEALALYCRDNGIGKLLYKPIPHIYHTSPSEEDLYCLHRCGGVLLRREMLCTIRIGKKVAYSKGRKSAVHLGKRSGLNVRRAFDFQAFIDLEAQVLRKRYNTQPVHTGSELELLANRFPDNIKLFVAEYSGEIVAGVVIYESECVAHTQYIGATEMGKRKGALDLIIDHLIGDIYREKTYFDFGTSSANNELGLEAGLIRNKQSFGARGIVQDLYEIDFTQPD